MEKRGNSAADVAKQLQLLPGFRFHPTDEELVVHYLARKAASRPFKIQIIAELDLYKFDPWNLPEKALIGEREWYFFSPRDRKYPNGARPNRAAGSGYWKATGTDKPIYSTVGESAQKVGVKKALVFYTGKAPRGSKTNWIMHEYRLTDSGGKPSHARRKGSLRLDDWVLCRIYNRSVGSQKAKISDQKSNAGEESCLEDVLASLPDIDDSKICALPGLGLGSTLPSTNIDRDDEYSLFDEFLCENLSENACKTDLRKYQEARIMQNSGTDDQSDLQDHSSGLLTSADIYHSSQMNIQDSYDPDHLINRLPHSDRSLRRPKESNMPDILQNLRSVKQRVSFDSADDDVQSTCRSPMFSRQQQSSKRHLASDLESQFFSSSVDRCLQPHDLVQLKTEEVNDSFFVNMDELFGGHLNRSI